MKNSLWKLFLGNVFCVSDTIHQYCIRCVGVCLCGNKLAFELLLRISWMLWWILWKMNNCQLSDTHSFTMKMIHFLFFFFFVSISCDFSKRTHSTPDMATKLYSRVVNQWGKCILFWLMNTMPWFVRKIIWMILSDFHWKISLFQQVCSNVQCNFVEFWLSHIFSWATIFLFFTHNILNVRVKFSDVVNH